MPSNSHFLFFFILCLLTISQLPSSLALSSNAELVQSTCLNVSPSEFASSIKSTISAIRDVTSIVSQFKGVIHDFRLSTALSDCLDLFDMSDEALSWSLSANNNLKGKNNSTGDLASDLKTWLSASLANQETCNQGFEGTNSIVSTLLKTGMNQVNSILEQLLAMVHHPIPFHVAATTTTHRGSHVAATKKPQYPPWITKRTRKLVESNSAGVMPDVTVALDGSGNFKNITAAILSAPDYSTKRYVIYVKKGVYKENVEIKKKKWNLMMVGDGMDVTVISGNRNFMDGWTTFRSATFAVSGRGFIARDITFENTAGPSKHQAVSLRSDSDLAVFFRCKFSGYQDTLYTHTMRQFFRECKISGTVDFIFGDGTVVFQNCQILARKGLPNQKNTITAQGRKDPGESTGFSIQFCNITADSDLQNSVNSTSTYLGRPWKLYSRTIIMQSYISNAVRPEGWLEWNGDFALDTLTYGEYLNYGPGAGVGSRVKWRGYQVINDTSYANNFTVSHFIKGDLWLPLTGVRFTSGLAT